jgi:hypothetical protein
MSSLPPYAKLSHIEDLAYYDGAQVSLYGDSEAKLYLTYRTDCLKMTSYHELAIQPQLAGKSVPLGEYYIWVLIPITPEEHAGFPNPKEDTPAMDYLVRLLAEAKAYAVLWLNSQDECVHQRPATFEELSQWEYL